MRIRKVLLREDRGLELDTDFFLGCKSVVYVKSCWHFFSSVIDHFLCRFFVRSIMFWASVFSRKLLMNVIAECLKFWRNISWNCLCNLQVVRILGTKKQAKLHHLSLAFVDPYSFTYRRTHIRSTQSEQIHEQKCKTVPERNSAIEPPCPAIFSPWHRTVLHQNRPLSGEKSRTVASRWVSPSEWWWNYRRRVAVSSVRGVHIWRNWTAFRATFRHDGPITYCGRLWYSKWMGQLNARSAVTWCSAVSVYSQCSAAPV